MASTRATISLLALLAALLAVGAGWLYSGWRGAVEARRAASADAAGLKTRVAALEKELQDRKSEIGQLNAQIQNLKSAESQAATARTELEQRRDALRIENSALASKAAELEADKRSLQQKLGAAQAQAEQAAAAHSEASKALSTTQQTLAEAKARAAKLNQSYEALLKEKSQIAQTTSAQEDELRRVREAFEQSQAEVARLTGARGIYTVQKGDSLSKIAAFFYHDGYRWPDVMRANAHLIGDNPDLIYPQQVLIIPN